MSKEETLILKFQRRKPSGPLRCFDAHDEEGQDPPLRKTNESIVFVVTPTYARETQYSDMMQVGQSLMLAKNNVFWVVVEDSLSKTKYFFKFCF